MREFIEKMERECKRSDRITNFFCYLFYAVAIWCALVDNWPSALTLLLYAAAMIIQMRGRQQDIKWFRDLAVKIKEFNAITAKHELLVHSYMLNQLNNERPSARQ